MVQETQSHFHQACVYTNCNELRKHKEKKKDARADNRSGKRQKAHNVEHSSDSENSARAIDLPARTTVDLISPPPTPWPPAAVNTNSKRTCDPDASTLPAIRQLTVSNTPVWPLDIRASRHTVLAGKFVRPRISDLFFPVL